VLFISGLPISGRPKGSVLPQSSRCKRPEAGWEEESELSERKGAGHKKNWLISVAYTEPTSEPLSAEKRI
jgi:hypothetical protein